MKITFQDVGVKHQNFGLVRLEKIKAQQNLLSLFKQRRRDSPIGIPSGEPPVPCGTTVFAKGIPMGQDRRIRPLLKLSLYF